MARSIYAISAMCGCMRWESTLNPLVWESNDPQTWSTLWHRNSQGYGVGGFGLGQWTNTGSGDAMRLERMYNWMAANGKDIYNGNDQMAYLLVERYNGRDEGIWYNSWHTGSNAQTLHEFLETTSTDLNGLTGDFLANWEGVPNDHLSERQGYAREILDYIRLHENDDPTTVSWQTPSSWTLPTSATLNNALCIYFFLQGYDPGPPHPGNLTGFVNWCIQKCNDPNVGYSQAYRDEQTIGGITYYDCSSFVWYGLYHNSFDVASTAHPTTPFDTTTMAADLADMGFVEIDRSGLLQPGDIGITPTHTEVCYQGGTGADIGKGIFMGAHNDSLPLADQVSINNYTSNGTDFTSIWRFQTYTPPTPSGGRRKMPLWMMLRRLPF